MRTAVLTVAVVVVVLSGEAVTAQPLPTVGGLGPPGTLDGYSPLVPTIDMFPSKTSPYAPSLFGPNGGRRVYPQLIINPRRTCPPSSYPSPYPTVVVVREKPRPAPPVRVVPASFETAGPVIRPWQQGLNRFAH